MNAREWVLAVRLRQLGDVIATLEVLRAVSQSGRAVALVVDAGYAELVREFGFIDRVMLPPANHDLTAWRRFLSEVRALRATAALDFHGSARSAFIVLASGAPLRVGFDVRLRRRAYTVVEPRADWKDGVIVPRTSIASGMRLARHLGAFPAGTAPPRLATAPEARARVRWRMIRSGVPESAFDAGRVVGLNPGRAVPAKRWASERFAKAAHELVRAGNAVVVLWGPGEESAARAVVEAAGVGTTLAPGFKLGELPAALSNLAGLVTIDSGLKHLAVCVRIPTVTLFGPTDPREWHMGTPADRVVWKGLSCSPCRRLVCPFGEPPCMDIAHTVVLRELELARGAVA